MQKINFKNLPDTSTPLNATNLNLMQDNIETAINSVVDSDTNSNGSWTKFEDGTLIYRKIVSKENFLASSELKTTVQGIDIFRSEIATINLPLNFIDTNYTVSIAISNDIVGSRAMLPKIHSKDTNAIRIQLIGLESFTSSGIGYTNLDSVDLTAIGRWK